MKWENKIFWQYIYEEHIHPKNFIRKFSFYKGLLIALSFYIIFLTKISLNLKAYTFLITIILYTIIELYSLKKSGIAKRWYREKYGIPTSSQIKKMKKEKTNSNI